MLNNGVFELDLVVDQGGVPGRDWFSHGDDPQSKLSSVLLGLLLVDTLLDL